MKKTFEYSPFASAPVDRAGRIRKRARLTLLVIAIALLFTAKTFAQTYYAVDVEKLISYSSEDDQVRLKSELRNSLGGESNNVSYPLYAVIPVASVKSRPIATENADPSSSKDTPSAGAFLIYRNELDKSSISGEAALFIQAISTREELSASLTEIVKKRPREIFDGDLVVLDSEDLEDLRRIISINRGEDLSIQIQQFRAVSNFIEKQWDRRNLVLGSLPSARFTLVTGMKGGVSEMTIIHCLPDTTGPLPVVRVGLGMQQIVREFFEIVQGSFAPVSIRVKAKPIGVKLTQEQIEDIAWNLSLVLRKADVTVMYEQVIERRVEGQKMEIALFALVPRSFLRGGAVSVRLRSDQFAFVDPDSRQRVHTTQIASDKWWQNESDDSLENTVQIVEAFDGRGERHEDFRSYFVPLQVSTDLSRPECREGLNTITVDEASGQGYETGMSSDLTQVVCVDAWRYLAAIVREIRIATSLRTGLNVFVILDEPSVRWPRLLRGTREAADIIAQFIRSKAGKVGLAESAVQSLIRVGRLTSEKGIEIKLVEGSEAP